MKAKLTWDSALRFVGVNEKKHETYFDTSLKGGGLDSAASPMEVLLEAAAACTAMDIIAILQKKRRTVTTFSIDLSAERAEQHPKVFTKIAMDIHLVSPDATDRELTRAIELSQANYCSVSIMLARSGCEISWRAVLRTPLDIERATVALGGIA
jgi:putative redox protein